MSGVSKTAEAPKKNKGITLLQQWNMSSLQQWNEGPLVRILCLILGAFITIIALSWAIEIPLKLGFQWLDEQAMVICYGLVLGIVFIRFPVGGGKDRPSIPWYDAILALLGIGACSYLLCVYEDIELNPFAMRPTMFWISLIILPLTV